MIDKIETIDVTACWDCPCFTKIDYPNCSLMDCPYCSLLMTDIENIDPSHSVYDKCPLKFKTIQLNYKEI